MCAGGGEGGDGKHTRSSAPAQHCIHTRERATHAVEGGVGGGMVSTPAQVHPLSTASTHAKAEAHFPRTRKRKRTCSSAPAQHCIHACGGGGGGGEMVSTPAQAHPLGAASTHAKEEAHLHPRMRVSGFSQVASCCL